MTPLYKHIEELREVQQKLATLRKLDDHPDSDVRIYAQDELIEFEERESDLYDVILVELGLHPLEDRHRLTEFIRV